MSEADKICLARCTAFQASVIYGHGFHLANEAGIHAAGLCLPLAKRGATHP